MKLYRTSEGIFVQCDASFFQVDALEWDDLLMDPDLVPRLSSLCAGSPARSPAPSTWLAPIGSQEVWAAGVTYLRSREARMEEAEVAGGSDFYQRIYTAARPELFFKSSAARVVGPSGPVRVRSDSYWSVPEPELTLVINAVGSIIGYTIGNDMSSRDIEGENPLYLPQAKVYDGSCALGPCIFVSPSPLPRETRIALSILRGGATLFQAQTALSQMKRGLQELVEYLYRELSFPQGVFLMTGTGIVPEDGFSLASGDLIRISVDAVGVLENHVL